MENKVRFKLHKVKKHWITIAASSLAIGASLIGLGQVGADEVKPETTAVNSPENVVSDSNLETSASLITRTEVAPTSTVVGNTSSEAVSTDTTSTNVASQPAEATATQPANETDKRVGQLQLMKQLLLIGALKSHLGQATTQLLHRKHLPKVASSLLMIKATGII